MLDFEPKCNIPETPRREAPDRDAVFEVGITQIHCRQRYRRLNNMRGR